MSDNDIAFTFSIEQNNNLNVVFQVYAAGTVWGSIQGDISNQEDLQNELNTLDGKIDSNHSEITTISNTMQTYGDIVTHNTTEFATATQGILAETALQPNDNITELTNNAGYITGIDSNDVTTALGYTPVNPTSLATVATSGSYSDLSNKPTIGDGTTTFYVNSDSVGTITANQTSSITITIPVPTTATEIGALPSDTMIEDLTTQAQQAALDSGITATGVTQIATNTSAITTINGKVPNDASTVNQLTTESFVNSSISTNTANFIGTFNSVADLEAYTGTVTNNDYAFVISTDTAGNTVYNRYKYNANTQTWLFEYALNNSSFTSDQWAAINSGITTSSVSAIAANTSAIQNKQDALTAGNNIQINGNTISATDTTYSAGANITITNGTISATNTIYTLLPATTSTLGGIKVGNNLTIASDGTLDAISGGSGTVTSVNNISPDAGGNVTLTASDVGAITSTDLQAGLDTKQDTLVSGTNIKTINTIPLLGDGNLPITGGTDIDVTTSSLSSGYTQVGYLESFGTQYIDTGRIPNNTDIIEQKFQVKQLSNTTIAWYGSMPSSSEITPRIGIGTYILNGITKFFVGVNATNDVFGIPADTNPHTIWWHATSSNTLEFSTDGSDLRTVEYSGNFYAPIINMTSYLFARHGTDGVQVYDGNGTKIYYHREYLANGTLVLNMIPARRNSDNELGMYDLVSGQFFTNQGTGSFSAGNDVAPITSSGIEISFTNDTGYVLSSDLATVATSGSYVDLSNKPTVDQTYDATSANAQSGTAVASAISTKVSKTGDTITGNLEIASGLFCLEGIGSSVSSSTSKLVLGTPNNQYSYLTGNTNGAFGIYSEMSGTRKGIACYPNQNFFADATTNTIDLGRSNNVWKTGFINTLSDGTNSKTVADIISGSLPSQTGHAGDILTTDGTDASWGDTTTIYPVIETYINGTSWYRIYAPDSTGYRWCEQGGRFTRTATGKQSISLLKNCVNTNYSILATLRGAESYDTASTFYAPYVLNQTTSGFDLSTSAAIANIAYFTWEARGYIQNESA